MPRLKNKLPDNTVRQEENNLLFILNTRLESELEANLNHKYVRIKHVPIPTPTIVLLWTKAPTSGNTPEKQTFVEANAVESTSAN
jgi:hypothetical protein